MKPKDLFRYGCTNLFRRKTRTALTALSMAVGVMCIVVLISVGLGYEQAYRESIEALGSLTKIDVTPATGDYGRKALLNDKALEAFRGIDGVEAVTPVYQQSAYIVSGNYVNMVRVYGIDMTTAERFRLTPERGVMAGDGTRLHPEVLFTDDVAAGLANKAKDWELAVDENGNALIDLLEVPVRMTFDSSSLTGEPKADTDGRALPSSNLYTLRVTGICSTLNNNFATAAFMSFDRLQEMTQANANYMGATMAVAEAQSASVYRKASMLIKQIFADALTCDLIQVDPTTKYTFKRVRREKEDTGEEYLTDAQVATLLAAIKGIYPLETFVKLGLYAGLRREESLALQWDCVDLNADTPQIEVTRTCIFCHNRPEISNVTKTAAGHRNIPIPVPLFNHLKGIKKSVASDFVICNSSGLPLSETQFRNMWRKIKRRSVGPDEYIRYKQHGKKSHSVNREAGQTAAHNPNVRYIIDFPVKTHMLRKTYITNLIYSGVDVRTVMDYAGHKNPDITLKIYAQPKTAEKRTESAKQINEVFPSDPTT